MSTFVLTRWVFLRCLGIVYLIAFSSLWVQVMGLFGEKGILPIRHFTRELSRLPVKQKLTVFPSIFWLNASDRALHLVCATGVVASVLLVVNIVPYACLVVLFVLYLSLTAMGQDFLSFQWDALLIETGFLALFFTPGSQIMLMLLWWLLFRLMFESGVVKLSCGDRTWRKLTALDYHYFTQPLPTWPAWYFHHTPGWFRHFSVLFTFFVELVLPFLIWWPGIPREIACFGFIYLMFLIALTGNYTFFNLLTAVLALCLLNDGFWTWLPVSLPLPGPTPLWLFSLQLFVAAVVAVVSVPQLIRSVFPSFRAPKFLRAIERALVPFRIVNSYGLFRSMTTVRPEITVEGSLDGKEWRSYRFRWKAGDPRRRPRYVEPHQPRLDWQMWFAALRGFEMEIWFQNFLVRLFEASPPVLKLLAEDPFPGSRPRYLRAELSKYEFTSKEEKRRTGYWWKVTPLGPYSPELYLGEPPQSKTE